eukprot:Em0021g544a
MGTEGHTIAQHQQNGTHRRGSFAFRKRWGQIDWRSLASVDVDRIAREMDFQQLQQNMSNVTFCNIEMEEFHDIDPNFIKLFKLAQLIIEYLLYSQQYLSDHVIELEAKIQDAQKELEGVRKQLADKGEEIKIVKKENRKRRKAIEAYQQMINAGATGLHACPVCKREFVSQEYLHAHILRRHPEHPSVAAEKKKEFHPDELERKLLEQVAERLRDAEAHLRDELLKKEQTALAEKDKEFDEWKKAEQQRMKQEMEECKKHINAELELLRKAKEAAEEALEEKEAELNTLRATKKASHLGLLEGAQEMDPKSSELVVETKQTVVQLKEQLDSQVTELQSQLKKQETKWNKKLRELSGSQQDILQVSLEKVKVLESSLQESVNKKAYHEQSKLTKEIKILQEKLKEQENHLHNQQQVLASIQEKDSISVTPPPELPKSSLSHAEPSPTMPDEIESCLSPGSPGVDDSDGMGFTPYPLRPQIHCRYDHSPELLGSLKQESLSILNDALVQRGIPLNAGGISASQYEQKISSLEGERQQRVQMHFNFLEQREALAREVDSISSANCVFKLRQGSISASPKRPSSVHSEGLSSSLPVNSKPPKPAKLSSSQPATSLPTSPVPEAVATISDRPAVRYRDSESEPESESTDEADGGPMVPSEKEPKEEPPAKNPVQTTSTVVLMSGVKHGSTVPDASIKKEQPLNAGEGAPSKPVPTDDAPGDQESNLEDISPWDSETDDSIEKMVFGPHSSRASSTPIKVQSVSAQLSLKPDPTKRPPGGVQIFSVAKPTALAQKDESEDSFDISKSDHDHPGPSKPTQQVKSHDDVSDGHSKPLSRTATSKSALTTVSVADFDDSDLSDIETMNLT